jgi:hypothetical protein
LAPTTATARRRGPTRKPGEKIAGFDFIPKQEAEMPARRGGPSGIIVLLAVATLLSGFPGPGGSARAAQADDGAGARVRIVHGIPDAGPVDVYVDGSLALIGIVFSEVSASLNLTAGEHAFSVAPTGADPGAPLVAGAISLRDETGYYAALIGTLETVSVGLFAIDERPLDAGRARFRVINGTPDVSQAVPGFTGGDALSEPLGFGDASQYSAIDAGTYDFDVLDGDSGALLLSLPQTVLAEGTATDIFLVGQSVDGTLIALIEPVAVAVTQAEGQTAAIIAGTCDTLQAEIASLGPVRAGQGGAVGVPTDVQVGQGYGLAPVSFATLTAAPHAVVVLASGGAVTDFIACGNVGGALTDTGALVIALHTAESDQAAGVAVLAPGLEDPETTGVSVFLAAAGAGVGPDATPAAEAE